MTSVKKVKVALLALVAALVIAIPTAAFADAADVNAKITINDKSPNHEYTVYQIFKGKFDGNKITNATVGDDIDLDKLYANIKADTNSDLDAVRAALKEKDPENEGQMRWVPNPTAAQLAFAIGDNVGSNKANWQERDVADAMAIILANSLKDGATGTPTTYANEQYATAEEMPSGYYLIQDKLTAAAANTKDSVSKYILTTTTDPTVNAKRDVPNVTKEVKEDSSITDTTPEGTWGKVGTYEIGQKFDYKIVGTLPSDYANYVRYYYKFTDSMSKGLKLLPSTIVVELQDKDGNVKKTVTDSFKKENGEFDITGAADQDAGTTLVLECANLKAIEEVEIAATDKFVVTYKCMLTNDAVKGQPGNPNEVDLEFSNNPNQADDGTPDETGKTPKQYCVVFTFDILNNKIDGNGASLVGAGFKLQRLTDGKWFNGYSEEDGEIQWVEGTWDASKQDALKDGVSVGLERMVSDATDTKGQLRFDGLDANESYKLWETTVPAGFTKPSDGFEFTINVKNSDQPINYNFQFTKEPASNASEIFNQVYLGDADKATANSDKQLGQGLVERDIENTSGTPLPSTGGIGTTIFTIVGIALIVAAAAIMVVRRRNAAAIQ